MQTQAQMQVASDRPKRLIRKPEACDRIGISSAEFDRRQRADPIFAAIVQKVQLGPHAVAYVEHTIDAYIDHLIAAPSIESARALKASLTSRINLAERKAAQGVTTAPEKSA